jgi:hypothetical protein
MWAARVTGVIDVPGEGVIFVQGLTLETLTAGDVLL